MAAEATPRSDGAWGVLLAGRRHLRTADVQQVCDRFRELRGAGGTLSDSWLTLEEFAGVLGVTEGDGDSKVQPLFELLRASEETARGEDATFAAPRCDLRVLLVAMAGLTRAKVHDRMRFAALLLDEDETGFLSHEQLALVMRANALLGDLYSGTPRVRSASSPTHADRARTLIQASRTESQPDAPAQISHEAFLDLVERTPTELCISEPPPKRAKTSSRATPTSSRSEAITSPTSTAAETPLSSVAKFHGAQPSVQENVAPEVFPSFSSLLRNASGPTGGTSPPAPDVTRSRDASPTLSGRLADRMARRADISVSGQTSFHSLLRAAGASPSTEQVQTSLDGISTPASVSLSNQNAASSASQSAPDAICSLNASKTVCEQAAPSVGTSFSELLREAAIAPHGESPGAVSDEATLLSHASEQSPDEQQNPASVEIRKPTVVGGWTTEPSTSDCFLRAAGAASDSVPPVSSAASIEAPGKSAEIARELSPDRPDSAVRLEVPIGTLEEQTIKRNDHDDEFSAKAFESSPLRSSIDDAPSPPLIAPTELLHAWGDTGSCRVDGTEAQVEQAMDPPQEAVPLPAQVTAELTSTAHNAGPASARSRTSRTPRTPQERKGIVQRASSLVLSAARPWTPPESVHTNFTTEALTLSSAALGDAVSPPPPSTPPRQLSPVSVAPPLLIDLPTSARLSPSSVQVNSTSDRSPSQPASPGPQLSSRMGQISHRSKSSPRLTPGRSVARLVDFRRLPLSPSMSSQGAAPLPPPAEGSIPAPPLTSWDGSSPIPACDEGRPHSARSRRVTPGEETQQRSASLKSLAPLPFLSGVSCGPSPSHSSSHESPPDANVASALDDRAVQSLSPSAPSDAQESSLRGTATAAQEAHLPAAPVAFADFVAASRSPRSARSGAPSDAQESSLRGTATAAQDAHLPAAPVAFADFVASARSGATPRASKDEADPTPSGTPREANSNVASLGSSVAFAELAAAVTPVPPAPLPGHAVSKLLEPPVRSELAQLLGDNDAIGDSPPQPLVQLPPPPRPGIAPPPVPEAFRATDPCMQDNQSPGQTGGTGGELRDAAALVADAVGSPHFPENEIQSGPGDSMVHDVAAASGLRSAAAQFQQSPTPPVTPPGTPKSSRSPQTFPSGAFRKVQPDSVDPAEPQPSPSGSLTPKSARSQAWAPLSQQDASRQTWDEPRAPTPRSGRGDGGANTPHATPRSLRSEGSSVAMGTAMSLGSRFVAMVRGTVPTPVEPVDDMDTEDTVATALLQPDVPLPPEPSLPPPPHEPPRDLPLQPPPPLPPRRIPWKRPVVPRLDFSKVLRVIDGEVVDDKSQLAHATAFTGSGFSSSSSSPCSSASEGERSPSSKTPEAASESVVPDFHYIGSEAGTATPSSKASRATLRSSSRSTLSEGGTKHHEDDETTVLGQPEWVNWTYNRYVFEQNRDSFLALVRCGPLDGRRRLLLAALVLFQAAIILFFVDVGGIGGAATAAAGGSVSLTEVRVILGMFALCAGVATLCFCASTRTTGGDTGDQEAMLAGSVEEGLSRPANRSYALPRGRDYRELLRLMKEGDARQPRLVADVPVDAEQENPTVTVTPPRRSAAGNVPRSWPGPDRRRYRQLSEGENEASLATSLMRRGRGLFGSARLSGRRGLRASNSGSLRVGPSTSVGGASQELPEGWA